MFDTGFAVRAEQLAVLTGELVADFDPAMTGPQAAQALPELIAAGRLVDLLIVQHVERVDRSGEYSVDGSASAVAWVRGISGEGAGWASRRVNLGRALADRLPQTAAAWARGTLGMDHAAVIAKLTAKLDDELTAEIEAILAQAAAELNPAELNSLGEAIKGQAAPDEAADDAAAKRKAQTLSISQTLDGRWRIDGWLDAEGGMYVSAAIASLLRTASFDPDTGLDPVGLRRAEALIEMAIMATAHHDTCAASGSGSAGSSAGRHTIIATLPFSDLKAGLGTADVLGGTTITAATARRMACDANLIPAVLGADSEVLDFGRTRRIVSPGLRVYLGFRDGGCLFPDCDRPASRCEAHHRQHWLRLGPTVDTNLDLYCTFHHHLVHEGGWTYKIHHAGTKNERLAFTPPGGGPIRYSKRRMPGHLRT